MAEDIGKHTVVIDSYGFASKRDLPKEIKDREVKSLRFDSCVLSKIPDTILKHSELEEISFCDCELPNGVFRDLAHFTQLRKLTVYGRMFLPFGVFSIVPKTLQQLKSLTVLNLTHCDLRTFPEEVTKLTSLQELSLKGNYIRTLPDSIKDLVNLRKINLSDCRSLSYLESVSTLSSLKELNLRYNRNIREISSSITQLTNLEILYVIGCGLSSYPESVSTLSSLKELNLSSNENIREISSSITQLTNLEILYVIGCGLSSYPEALSTLSSLKELNLSSNENIREISSSITQLTNLEILYVKGCGLSSYPEALSTLSSLKELNLSENQDIREISSSITQLTNLEILYVRGCGLSSYPEALSTLSSLKELNLSENQDIREISSSISQLTNLKILNVSGCGLIEYPEIVLQMPSLINVYIYVSKEKVNDFFAQPLASIKNTKVLDLSHSNFPTSPKFLHHLTQLQELDLSDNRDRHDVVQDSWVQLKHLKKLDISGCGLRYFPDVLCQLTGLRQLHMKMNNNIGSLPKTMVQLKNLEVLDVWSCGLEDFPEVICQLTALHKLSIGGNWIEFLPESLAQLQNLQKLNVADCGLTVFPEVICQLIGLHKLNISENWIEVLPESLAHLQNLQKLNVADCGLTVFPEVIGKLHCLQELQIHENVIATMTEVLVKDWYKHDLPVIRNLQKSFDLESLTEPPSSIFRKGPKACVQYFNSLKISSIVECKLLSVQVLGKTGSGKSSLIKTLEKNESRLVDPADRTIVADKVEIKERVEGDQILLQITDFGGHDIYELTCPLFLRASNVTTLVAIELNEYCEEKHDILVTKWLSTALAHMRTGHICVLGTQVDLCPKEEVESKMQMLKREVSVWMDAELKYIHKLNEKQDNPFLAERQRLHVSFFETSSRTLEGVMELKSYLFARAKENSLTLPGHWSKFYQKLLDQQLEDKHYLNKEEVNPMFKKSLPFTKKLKRNPNDLRLCLQLLHDMGMILWYGDNENLRDVVFHKMSFIITVLKNLFRHNLQESLPYDHEAHGKIMGTQIQYETEMARIYPNRNPLTDAVEVYLDNSESKG